jgi:hypothetical protein
MEKMNEKDDYPIKVSHAPEPITPVRGSSYTPSLKAEPEPYIPIDGNELMQRLNVGWKALENFLNQQLLIPKEPDFPHTTLYGMSHPDMTPQKIQRIFSDWLYGLSDVEAFEAKHGKIIDEWRRKNHSSKQDLAKLARKEGHEKMTTESKRNLPEAISYIMQWIDDSGLEPNKVIKGKIQDVLCKKYSVNVCSQLFNDVWKAIPCSKKTQGDARGSDLKT